MISQKLVKLCLFINSNCLLVVVNAKGRIVYLLSFSKMGWFQCNFSTPASSLTCLKSCSCFSLTFFSPYKKWEISIRNWNQFSMNMKGKEWQVNFKPVSTGLYWHYLNYSCFLSPISVSIVREKHGKHRVFFGNRLACWVVLMGGGRGGRKMPFLLYIPIFFIIFIFKCNDSFIFWILYCIRILFITVEHSIVSLKLFNPWPRGTGSVCCFCWGCQKLAVMFVM